MIFRDGLRVLPYGRTDNDFFEIESRRSMHAGREFWNHRQMFGRLAITRDSNPNLKDKAGREGLLDNRAAKTLKVLISNILKQSARRYFGTDADVRKELLPEINASNKVERANEARNKLRQTQRKKFRSSLQSYSSQMPAFVREVEEFGRNLEIHDEAEIADVQQRLEDYRERAADFRLPGAPKALGPLETTYSQFRSDLRNVHSILEAAARDIEAQIEQVSPAEPRHLLEKQIARNAGQLHHRILRWKRAIDALQKSEFERIKELVAQRNKVFHAEATPLLARFDRGEMSYLDASKMLDRLKEDTDTQNSDIFEPYIGALESLKESIDLEHLASFGMEELGDMRAELERLNSLAQLGIAVEIVGHELQAYDDIIGSALERLPAEVRKSKAGKDIEFGYDGLTDQLRFLSPLRIAGQRVQRWITGGEIADYMAEFFKLHLSRANIKLTVDPRFRSMRIYDQQSRLYPVFINLVNNSVYWVGTRHDVDREIALSVVGDEVVVSDNGPGVDAEDVDSLFSLFFTKKARGGRGVGLYLSRANLAAGGHRIRYASSDDGMPLPGANFVIAFRGIEFDAG
jgi:signal transduction histidine kinase